MAAPKEVFDFLGSFRAGVNSGVDPILLHKDQLAYAVNGSLRGDFIKQRSAYNLLGLFYADDATQSDFQTGIFQGAAYYRPDSGPESIALQINGSQFLVTPSNFGTASVNEITIPGDPGNSSQPQAWICQAENFLIFNNGLDLPVFFDGTASRRSFGPSQLLGTVQISNIVPDIGQSISLKLNDLYTGPLNETIFIGGATYVVTQIGAVSPQYQVTLENLYDPDSAHNQGDSLVHNPSIMGPATFLSHRACEFQSAFHKDLSLLAVGQKLEFTFDNTTQPTLTSPIIVTITKVQSAGFGAPTIVEFTPNIQRLVQLESLTVIGNIQGISAPSVTIGTLAAGFVPPALNADVVAFLLYNTSVNVRQLVSIGNGLYKVTAAVVIPPAFNTTITVENINDVPLNTISVGEQLTTLPELPAGRALAYGAGRVWESMTDGLSFLASDIVDGSSGSPLYNGRDAVLKITENDFLAGGGLFRVPGTSGDIKAMQFCALLDVSLGQGPLQVFTPNCVFACQAPVLRSTWQTLTNPILTESLIGAGGTSQNSVTLSNGDIIFRSSDGFIRSLLMARLDFNRWSNTPISREMTRILALENNSLLAFSTGAVFDNRFLMGTGLAQTPRGTISTSLVALNFDPVSSLRGTDQSIYDGQWTGLNTLQLVSGFFNGTQRCFAICLSNDYSLVEIHEILPSDGPTADSYDNGTNPIPVNFESPTLDFGDREAGQHNYKRLKYGEIYVDSLVGPVSFQAFYKPDQWPNWVPWHSWTQPYSANSDPGYRPRIGLPMPDGAVFDETNKRPLREGFNFQFKLAITGPARFLGARFSADIIPQPEFATPVFP